MPAPTTGWKLASHHKTISSYDILVPNDSHCIISFLCWCGFGMLLWGKTQKKHPGDLPPTVPDLPSLPPQKEIHLAVQRCAGIAITHEKKKISNIKPIMLILKRYNIDQYNKQMFADLSIIFFQHPHLMSWCSFSICSRLCILFGQMEQTKTFYIFHPIKSSLDVVSD